MRKTLPALILSCGALCMFAMLGRSAAVQPAQRFTQHATPELGRVHWRRGFDAALSLSKSQGKPLLVLFDEVPGCSTCTGYGQLVLSHPLVVEAIESLFVPVAVFNNVRGGDDERVLRSFNEPAQNNPVVRIVGADRKDIVPRVDGDYTARGLVRAMLAALEKAGKTLPAYLRLLNEEMSAAATQRATFAMGCFWHGEGVLGGLSGVVKTTPGYFDGSEVVEVEFDPAVLPFSKLLDSAQSLNCTQRVITSTDAQQRSASARFGKAALRSDKPIKPDGEPKYYLAQSPLKFVPMTPVQAARVNSAVGAGQSGAEFLSPRELELLALVKAHPQAKWPNAIGAADLEKAWDAARAVAEGLK